MKKALMLLSFIVILCMSFTLSVSGDAGDGVVTMPHITIPSHTSESSSSDTSSSESSSSEESSSETSSEKESSSSEASSSETPSSSEEDSSSEESSSSESSSGQSEQDSTESSLPTGNTDYEASDIPFSSEPTTTAYDISNASISNIAVSSLKPCQLNVTWNVLSPRVSGYQVQFCTDASFAADNVKTIAVKGGTESSIVIHRLQRGQKYYVRVRAFYEGKDGTSYSKWSRTKSATIQNG